MIITIPASLKVATLDWQPVRFDLRYPGPTGQFQTASEPACMWRCTVTLPPMKPDNAGAVEAFLMQVSDLGNRFELGRDDRPLMGVGGGTPTVKGAGQTGRSVLTEGWTDGGVILRAGDMIQLGPNRLHMVTADVTSGASGTVFDENGDPLLDESGNPILVEGTGNASIPIEPALQSSPDDGQAITVGVNAKAVFMLDGGYSVTSTPGIFSGIAFSAIQDLLWRP